ncbi:alkaline phosphatase family protein [Micromonospora echinofusca]|uniref:Nucleotide pyrophosphatase n=1 Tax=Micromonospora echinofusca TaxID=47858 RepID=A0ABS3VR33_MICEH|nr:alkaline phosphatase family protein [Micromonospora echinofusca]MBO4206999.1 nucleotide pyrophosphatase [Micromonospora echinofusca]
MRTRATTVAAVAAAVLAAFTTTGPAARADAPVRKVLVVGMDGLNWANVVAADAPTLDGLAATGTLGSSLLYCGAVAASSSGPGWSTVATGVWPDRHGVRDNSFSGAQYGTYPDFLTRLEQANPARNTLSVVDWTPLHTQGTFGPAIDTRVTFDGYVGGFAAADAKVTTEAVSRLRDTNVDAAFVYLGNTDEVAHASGTGAAYRTAIETQDAQLRQMLDAIAARPTYAAEDWLVVVTTDHGHANPGGGHGGCGADDERRTWVLARGTGHAAGARPVDTRLVDVASTVFAHLGVPVNPAWNLDGKPLNVRATDPFDSLTLQPRVDETDIPTSVRGWTPTGPAGWTVDRSAMPTGGVTEWRGWSFTNEEFWARTHAEQERENGLRLRGVFAVADSDEFDDLPGGTTYDSTLISPAYPVTGGRTLSIRYVTHYLQEGGQTGDVLVSFNGKRDQLVKRYTADARAKVESLTVTVPSGATTVRVKFRYYNASNNWYWVVDDLRVAML